MSRGEVEFLQSADAASGGDDEVLDVGSRRPSARRRVRTAAGVAFVLALGAAATIGYTAGAHQRDRAITPQLSRAAAAAAPVPVPLAGWAALVQSPGQCAVQRGDSLQVGVQLVNQSGSAVTLRGIHVDAPSGMRVSGHVWGPCGLVPQSARAANPPVPTGGRAWLTITFTVLAPCRGPAPVLVTVDYSPVGSDLLIGTQVFADVQPDVSPTCGRLS